MLHLIGLLVVLFVLFCVISALWDVIVVCLQFALVLVAGVVGLAVFCAIVGALTH